MEAHANLPIQWILLIFMWSSVECECLEHAASQCAQCSPHSCYVGKEYYVTCLWIVKLSYCTSSTSACYMITCACSDVSGWGTRGTVAQLHYSQTREVVSTEVLTWHSTSWISHTDSLCNIYVQFVRLETCSRPLVTPSAFTSQEWGGQ